jgi:hypothetical protein
VNAGFDQTNGEKIKTASNLLPAQVQITMFPLEQMNFQK